MISVFKWDDNPDYETMGNAVILPISCKTKNIAGGAYDLSMEAPIDPEGKWALLKVGNVLKVPVQEETIENAYTGTEMWIYETATAAALRASASEPQTVTYPAWDNETIYSVGDKVTHGPRNFECTYYNADSVWAHTVPGICPWWKEIPKMSGGAAIIANLPAGTKLIWLEGQYSDTWWKMMTWAGVTGWIKQSQLTNEQHQTQEEVEPIIIRTQLFRIRSATVDTKEMRVHVEAQHVSYDANGSLIREAVISQANASVAIWMCQEGMFEPYTAGMICSNLTNTDNTYTQTIRGKSLIWALLDPKAGIVAQFDAAYKRDNWDLYIMQKQDTDRGFEIRFGKNLMGVSWTRSDDQQITRVIPVAKDVNGNDLYLPDVYVDSEDIDDYPVIRMEVLSVNGQIGKDDGTGTDTVWTEEALLDEMEAQAEKRFTAGKADQIQVEITIDFTMLGDTDEYKQYKRLEKAILYDIVKVVDERIGLNTQLRVVEVEWDCIREKVNAVKLSNVSGYQGGTVAGYMMLSQSVTEDKIGRATMEQIIDDAAEKAVRILS